MWRQHGALDGERSDLPARVDDFSPAPTTPPVYHVLLLVSHRRNRQLLTDWFESRQQYVVVDGMELLSEDERDSVADDDESADDEESPPGDAGFFRAPDTNPLDTEVIDLILVDVAALSRFGPALAERITREQPLPLPCLLLASETAAATFFSAGQGHERSGLVDDVVTTPVEPHLLERRLRAYLHLRQQAVNLDRRHDQLSLLASVLRHDIANAATVVTGWGEVLREEVTDDGVESLERVIRGGQRISELVENSRHLTSLIEAGNSIETEAVLLAPVLHAEAEAIRRVHSSTTRTVEITLDSELPPVEVIAGGMLPSVFANLLSNAVRHSDTDPTEIAMTVDVTPREVSVRVQDNGPGIPDENKELVFQPTKKGRDSPGDGLGLALVRRLVDSYGGRVWFEDRPDGESGVVACVTLRRTASAAG